LGASDCASGQSCAAWRCVWPDAGAPDVAAPPDAPPGWGTQCSYNSQCGDPLICRQGECAYECLGSADCPAGDACVASRCVAPAVDSGNEAHPDGPAGCTYNSECAAPFICRQGACAYECLGTADCS